MGLDVSPQGIVHLNGERIWPYPFRGKLWIDIEGKSRLLADVVLEHHDMPSTGHSKHLDQNPLNCAVDNLEWYYPKRRRNPVKPPPTNNRLGDEKRKVVMEMKGKMDAETLARMLKLNPRMIKDLWCKET